MAIASPPRPPVRTAVAPRRPTPSEHHHDCRAAWTLVGVLLAFKALTIGAILVAASPHTGLSLAVIAAMNWPWLIVLGVLLSVIPFGFWFRLLRARARRRRLQQAEWNLA